MELIPRHNDRAGNQGRGGDQAVNDRYLLPVPLSLPINLSPSQNNLFAEAENPTPESFVQIPAEPFFQPVFATILIREHDDTFVELTEGQNAEIQGVFRLGRHPIYDLLIGPLPDQLGDDAGVQDVYVNRVTQDRSPGSDSHSV